MPPPSAPTADASDLLDLFATSTRRRAGRTCNVFYNLRWERSSVHALAALVVAVVAWCEKAASVETCVAIPTALPIFATIAFVICACSTALWRAVEQRTAAELLLLLFAWQAQRDNNTLSWRTTAAARHHTVEARQRRESLLFGSGPEGALLAVSSFLCALLVVRLSSSKFFTVGCARHSSWVTLDYGPKWAKLAEAPETENRAFDFSDGELVTAVNQISHACSGFVVLLLFPCTDIFLARRHEAWVLLKDAVGTMVIVYPLYNLVKRVTGDNVPTQFLVSSFVNNVTEHQFGFWLGILVGDFLTAYVLFSRREEALGRRVVSRKLRKTRKRLRWCSVVTLSCVVAAVFILFLATWTDVRIPEPGMFLPSGAVNMTYLGMLPPVPPPNSFLSKLALPSGFDKVLIGCCLVCAVLWSLAWARGDWGKTAGQDAKNTSVEVELGGRAGTLGIAFPSPTSRLSVMANASMRLSKKSSFLPAGGDGEVAQVATTNNGGSGSDGAWKTTDEGLRGKAGAAEEEDASVRRIQNPMEAGSSV